MYFILVIMTVMTYTQELYKRRVSLTLNYNWAFVNLDNGTSASKLELESEELHLPYHKPPTLSWWWLKSGYLNQQITWTFDYVTTWKMKNLISWLENTIFRLCHFISCYALVLLFKRIFKTTVSCLNLTY